jgi:hypothetical protein
MGVVVVMRPGIAEETELVGVGVDLQMSRRGWAGLMRGVAQSAYSSRFVLALGCSRSRDAGSVRH